MKTLSENDLYRITEANETDAAAAVKLANAWGELVAGDVWEEKILLDMVRDGRAKAATVQDQSGPVYVIFYGVNALGWLFVHALIALRAGEMSVAEKACCDLARLENCAVIQCVTIRPGLFRFLGGLGYKPLGVVMIKNL